ncbi:hypothetical protein QQ045_028143 [Rhodiola kirilowii]
MGYAFPLWMLFVNFLLMQNVQTSAKIPAVIVFGDSSVDSGNNNHISTMLKSNFQPYGRDFQGGKPTGRFSNGKVPTDFISQAFGVKPTVPAYLDPAYNITDFADGVCFASAGTGYDNATSNVLSVIPLWKELEYYTDYQKKLRDYLGNDKANQVLSEAMYLMSIGTNDFLENYYMFPGTQRRYTIEEYQVYLAGVAENFVTELYHLGARKISIGGLPPMGCLPLERSRNFLYGGECVEEYNEVAKSFNAKLSVLVEKLNKNLTGMQLVLSSPYDAMLDIIRNPNSYGFVNAAVACCATGMFEMGYMCNRFNRFTCSDASKYVFWDSFHPTEKANQIMAEHVVKNSLAQFMV